MDLLFEMWPSFAAEQGIPAPDVGPITTAEVSPAPDPTQVQVVPEPLLAPEQQFQNIIEPQEVPSEASIEEVPIDDTNLFPTDALQVSQSDVDSAAPLETSEIETSRLGKALSGIKMPVGAGMRSPDAPGLPAVHPVESNLFALLTAAGIAPRQVSPGLGLGQRLK
jgi:hypothetical protein